MAYNVTVVSGTRAEYGLLRPVLEKIKQNQSLRLNFVVTGSHLSKALGYTLIEIEADGFVPDAKIDILSAVPGEDSRQLTAMRTAAALEKFCSYFAAMSPKPDVVLLLGDRYEILAAGQAAALLNIPLAHISGGDVTHGADDDWFRHCLTKMAKLHFPSCEEYRRRVIQMGEQPAMVHNVGGLGDENVRSMQLLDKAGLEESLGLCLGQSYALVTYHPETQSSMLPEKQAAALLEAMEANSDVFYLITKANADAGGMVFNHVLESWCKQRSNAAIFASLGALRYLSAMKYAALVLGNSSSGLAETPSMGVPCVNIGLRQSGRVRCDNIIDCPMEAGAIQAAVQMALTPDFRQKAAKVNSPYNGGDTSGKIVSILQQTLEAGTLKQPKIFYDAACAKKELLP